MVSLRRHRLLGRSSDMSSGGCDPPRPPSSRGDKVKGVKGVKGKKSRYVMKLRSHIATPPSSTPSLSAATIPSPSSTSPSPLSVPPQSAKQPTYSPVGFIMAPTPGLQTQSIGNPPPRQDNASSSRVDSTSVQDVEHMSDSGGDSPPDDEDPAPGTLPMIKPCGTGFLPSKTASKAITLTIRQQFRHPWISWGEIPKNDRLIFYNHFKKKVIWRPEHEDQIKKNFESRASHRLSEELCIARKKGKMPRWMRDDVWNRLSAKWNEPAYREKCEQAKKNRASEKGGNLHTGGSIGFGDHAVQMAEALGRAIHPIELFEHTHVRKGSGEYVDERSRRTLENYETRISQAMSEVASCQGGSASTPLDPVEKERLRTQCWLEAAGGKKKGQIYGIGNLGHGYRQGDVSFMNACSSRYQKPEEMVEMRRRLSTSEETARRALQAHARLERRFQSFIGAVLPFLPADARTVVQNLEDQQQPDDQQQLDDQQHQDGLQ